MASFDSTRLFPPIARRRSACPSAIRRKCAKVANPQTKPQGSVISMLTAKELCAPSALVNITSPGRLPDRLCDFRFCELPGSRFSMVPIPFSAMRSCRCSCGLVQLLSPQRFSDVPLCGTRRTDRSSDGIVWLHGERGFILPTLNTRRVTVYDIAKKLGCSHATVSLALRNDHRITPKRCETVKEAAKAMGYAPDPHLAALAAYRRRNAPATIRSALAWINHWDQPERLRKLREFDAYWRGALESAQRFGYQLEEIRWSSDFSAKRFQQIPVSY